ncbi:hypothetical protein ABZY81_32950 [Streptomyces sp. NPDC006514]|uniref:hypothetical protein n=1 Tax=Streptomyces sp. NPDC006514 TaxID=3154308 RepID=UPI0033A6D9E2
MPRSILFIRSRVVRQDLDLKSGGLIVTATCAVSLVLFAVPAHADEPVPTPSSDSALAARDKGGAGQGAPVAPSQAAAGPSITRSEVIKRAAPWVGIGLQYSWNNTYQGYRTDCSGFASMAWRLGTPGLDTTSFVPAGVASWIGKSDLKPGDALLNDAAGANGHIVVFGGWVNSARTSYRGYEFTGSGMHYREIPLPLLLGLRHLPAGPQQQHRRRRLRRSAGVRELGQRSGVQRGYLALRHLPPAQR